LKIPSSVIELAIEEAEKSTVKKAQMSAVIWDKKGILSSGYNQWLANTSDDRYNYFGVPYHSQHAEVSAILRLRDDWRWRLENASIFIYRRGWKLARPCKHCKHVLHQMGISRVYWSEDGGYISGYL
jgi:deoxycytidylate deaminase